MKTKRQPFMVIPFFYLLAGRCHFGNRSYSPAVPSRVLKNAALSISKQVYLLFLIVTLRQAQVMIGVPTSLQRGSGGGIDVHPENAWNMMS